MFIDAFHQRSNDTIEIVGRDKNDKRFFDTKKADFSFFVEDRNGTYNGIDGVNLSKVTVTGGYKQFQKEQKSLFGRKLYENDIKPLFKILENEYMGAELPPLHIGSIDIEVDFCKIRGYAIPEDPHQPITAISIGLDWLDQLITLSIKPKGITKEQAEEMAKDFENCFICDSEEELLKLFYDIIEDVDVFSTWNGTLYDLPYIINRTTKILGKEYTRKFCLWDQFPIKKTFERFGREQNSYDLIGRVHLDYLELYKKYTYHAQPSYKLDYIGEVELNERKIQYNGTLDQLYNNDYKKFLEYNRQDVSLLMKFEKKLKFINLTNIIAHENCVLFSTTIGSVALTDQAIILEAHRRGLRVQSRKHSNTSGKIAGAYVAKPIQGLIHWLGSVDLTSLYPSTIRALNMSPETLVGQVRHHMTDERMKNKADDSNQEYDEDDEDDKWEGLFASLEYDEIMKKTDVKFTIDLEGKDKPLVMSGKEIYEWVFSEDSDLCISANGTIFRTDINGVIPGLLEKWFTDRKNMQKKKKEFEKKIDEFVGDKKSIEYKELQTHVSYWDQRQLAEKILMNALYGAITNPGSRFYDPRLGQSTTLSGRTIAKHLNAKANELLTDEYDYKGKCIVMADTDSSVFTLEPILDQFKKQGIEFNKDFFVELANNMSEQINETFPKFITDSFNIMPERRSLIKCGREICAETGIFIKKKKYAILYYDKENIRADKDGKPGKLKIMGLDSQRADTAKPVQEYLKKLLMKVLTGHTEEQIIEDIREFREIVKKLPAWEKGTPKAVNNLTLFKQKLAESSKANLPQHVRASLAWNSLRKMNGDNHSMPITDGQKVIVCKLKNNPLGYTAIARPIDQEILPEWFKVLPFDNDAMETTYLDKKLQNNIGVLNYNLESSKMDSNMAKFFVMK